MATIGPSAGVCFVKIGPLQYQLRGSLTIVVGGNVATEISNLDGSLTYTEKPQPGTLDMELSDSGGLSLVTLQGLRSVYATAELANGKSYGYANAFTTGEVSLNAETGAVKMKISGIVTELGVSS